MDVHSFHPFHKSNALVRCSSLRWIGTLILYSLHKGSFDCPGGGLLHSYLVVLLVLLALIILSLCAIVYVSAQGEEPRGCQDVSRQNVFPSSNRLSLSDPVYKCTLYTVLGLRRKACFHDNRVIFVAVFELRWHPCR